MISQDFHRRLALVFALILGWTLPCHLPAQEPDAWNSAEALQLVDRGIANRGLASTDTSLHNYRADGRGFVYFLLDAPEMDRQSLVRTDQVALEVYWSAPNDIRQRVVGLRQKTELPVRRLYYYLDRLTVVQDNYGSAIVIADGDNVNDVPHPVAPGGTDFYDYRIASRLTLRLPGLPTPVEVVELQVRPKDAARPALVGSVFLAVDTGALVRMAFTFTPAAYVDPRLDYIHVNLENGLWEGRYWLPYEQRLEIRRELPELDLPFGTVIRTRMRIGGYRFNQDLPPLLFESPYPVTFVPEEVRRAFPFEESIDSQRRLEGIGVPADVEEIRDEARRMLRQRATSGLPTRRLGVGSVSDVFSYNRADALRLGAGLAFRPSDDAVLRTRGGYAFGPRQPSAEADWQQQGPVAFTAALFANRTADVGHEPPISRAANTLSALALGNDWLDPFYASGAEFTAHIPLSPSMAFSPGASIQRQRSAERTTGYSIFDGDGDFRTVRPIEEATRYFGSIGLTRNRGTPVAGTTLEVSAGLGRLQATERDRTFGELTGSLEGFTSWGWQDARLEGGLSGGWMLGRPAVQDLFFAGGRTTAPGFDYRSTAGTAAARFQLLGSAELLHPWLRGRLSGGAALVGTPGDAPDLPAGWSLTTDPRLLPYVGIGAGLFYDLLQIDLARGLGEGGRYQVIFEFQPAFHGFL